MIEFIFLLIKSVEGTLALNTSLVPRVDKKECFGQILGYFFLLLWISLRLFD